MIKLKNWKTKGAACILYMVMLVIMVNGCGTEKKEEGKAATQESMVGSVAPSGSAEGGTETGEQESVIDSAVLEGGEREDNANPAEDEKEDIYVSAMEERGGGSNTEPVVETQENGEIISPATDALSAVQLFYQGYNEHNTAYMKAATLDEAEAGELAVLGGDEEAYWENHDADQGSWFNVGIFTSYEIDLAAEKPVEDLKTLQESLASDYGFQGIIEEACEIDFNRIIHGTEATVTKEDNYALVVKVDGYWYLVQRILS